MFVNKFLAIFTCAENSVAHEAWKKLSRDEQQSLSEKGMTATDEWFDKHKEQIVDKGAMLGENTTLVDKNGIKTIPSKMGYFLIIKAASRDEAAQMFINHPHFTFFPGDGIEIIELTNTPRS